MNWGAVFAKLVDPYDIKARLFPGLLVLLPAIAFLALLYGHSNPVLATLASVLSTCGGPYLLASFVRTWGQRAQEALYKKWGAQPTTILLRHRDQRLSNQTKLRYQHLATSKLGVTMPSRDQEADDTVAADHAYVAAADALRPLTVDQKKYPFVFKELVAYGYNRNAYGVRWLGAGVAMVVIVATLAHAGVLQTTAPLFRTQNLLSLKFAHVLTLALSVSLLLMWLFHFTRKTVEQAGFSYALRLWESLETIGKKSAPKRPIKKAEQSTGNLDTPEDTI